MKTIIVAVAATLAFFAFNQGARAQTTTPQAPATPPPEALAAAHELMAVIKPEDRFKVMLPVMMQNLKPAVVQGRPEVEKQYDATMPILLEKAQKRVDELANTIATIYAGNFTAAELRDLIAFYKTPTGQKLLLRTTDIAQQSMAAGQELGRAVVRDVQEQMQAKDHAN